MDNHITKSDVLWGFVLIIGLLLVALPMGLTLGFML